MQKRAVQKWLFRYNVPMEIVVEYGVLFFLGAIGGWIIELFFRRYVSQKKWVNPGFLAGPVVPLYGFGIVSFYFFANVIPWQSISSISWLNTLIEVFAAGLFMTVIEFVAGLIFIKGMHVKLWDYSKRPGNIMGIICPLFSLIWLACGALYVYVFNPWFVQMMDAISAQWIYWSFPLGIALGILIVDFGYSVHLATRIRQSIADSKVVASWEKMKVSFQEHLQERKQHSNFLLAFSTKKENFDAMVRESVAKNKKEYDDWVAMKMAKKEARKAKKKAK